jgi:hypothetical protein
MSPVSWRRNQNSSFLGQNRLRDGIHYAASDDGDDDDYRFLDYIMTPVQLQKIYTADEAGKIPRKLV